MLRLQPFTHHRPKTMAEAVLAVYREVLDART